MLIITNSPDSKNTVGSLLVITKQSCEDPTSFTQFGDVTWMIMNFAAGVWVIKHRLLLFFFTLKKFNCWTIFSGADNLEELFILNKIQTENVTGSLSVTWYWYLEGRTARIHSSEYSSYNYRFQKKRNLIVDTMCIGNNFKWFFLSLHSIMETFHCYTIHFTCNFLF